MKWNKLHIVLTFLLPVWYGIVQLLSKYPQLIEKYYSNGIYLYISKILRLLFGWIPFSFGDILLGALMLYLCYEIYKLIKKRFKDIIPTLLRFTSFLSVIYFCFYFFWGLNYFREPLAINLGYNQSKYSNEELIITTNFIIEKLNSSQFKITKNDTLRVENIYSQKKMYNLALNGYENLTTDFPQLEYTNKSVKNSLFSLLQSYNGTAGYFNPLTGEAQVNKRIPKASYPTTTCHEMAHQIGYAAENEANFVGFLAASYNKDIYFQYAAYRMAFGYCISELRKRDTDAYKTLWKKVNKGIGKDFKNTYNFWQSYKNPIEPYIKKGYNSYLKANKQDKGIESYNYVVDLLISYYKTEL